jgi:hypothetical protein
MIAHDFFHVLQTICKTLYRVDMIWAVTGSLGFALRGIDVPVNDIDLQTDKFGAYRIERCFADQIVRKVTFSSSEKIRSHFGELRINGIKVEIMGALQKRLPDGNWETPVVIRNLRKKIHYQGLIVPVLSLKPEYEAYRKLGRFEKAELIRKYLEGNGLEVLQGYQDEY